MNRLHWNKITTDLQPDRQWVGVTKHRILAEIGRRQRQRSEAAFSFVESVRFHALSITRRFVPRYQYVVGATLMIALSVSTGVMARAAMPGDMLWPMKLTIEKAEIAFATNAEQESRIHLRHVENRLHELSFVSAQHGDDSTSTIAQVVRRLEKDMTMASQSFKQVKDAKQDSAPQVVLALANDLTDKTQRAADLLSQNKRKLMPVLAASVQQGSGVSTTTQVLASIPTDAPEVAQIALETATATPEEIAKHEQDLKREAYAIKTITEVQIVNQYISYSTLSALVDAANRQDIGRYQAKVQLDRKIAEQEKILSPLQDAVQLVNANYAKERTAINDTVTKAVRLVKESRTYLQLDDLTNSLWTLTQAKDFGSQAAQQLQVIAAADGLKPIVPKPQVLVPKPVGEPVSAQGVIDAIDPESNEPLP